jgi:4-hydroxy-3-methylbut-2-enyl diphosphate reductase
MSFPTSATRSLELSCLLAFNSNNQIAVRKHANKLHLAFTGEDLEKALNLLELCFENHTQPKEKFSLRIAEDSYKINFLQIQDAAKDSEIEYWNIETLENTPGILSPALAAVLKNITPYLVEIPYLHLGENDFIYKFRPEKERNSEVYSPDAEAGALYQSKLCSAIKTLARKHERTADAPVTLDFGSVVYVIPSHFGFCLGVKNAIERAYETLAENPSSRVFMLSELIHNPFVNADLIKRGLKYLQTDKGIPYGLDGTINSSPLLWDTLTPKDIVIIPAFGATDEDKVRLVKKGVAVFNHDATCMLVEKVWKAARIYGRDGYTVVIHGKYEHEETKATFSNTKRYAPAVIVRNLEEAQLLSSIICSKDPKVKESFYSIFKGKHTPNFDVNRDLEHIAVVNQTTLLVNETREIITHLREIYAAYYGADTQENKPRVGGSGRTDTLCYATQVNQDALTKALEQKFDAAFVIGGRNSSNTYQLYRLCAEKLKDKAFFIQSEANIKSIDSVEHFVFPAIHSDLTANRFVDKDLWPEGMGTTPRRILITGGASCPDGIIQQVIHRINGFLKPESLKSIDHVLQNLNQEKKV